MNIREVNFMLDIQKIAFPADFLTDPWRRETYFSKEKDFFSKFREKGKGEGEKSAEGSDALKLNLSAPKLEPPFEMTSPHPLMSQGRTPRLRMTGFFDNSKNQDIKKKLEAKGYAYTDYLSLKKEQGQVTLADFYRHMQKQEQLREEEQLRRRYKKNYAR
ncbi:MAG: hypothetical protein ACD_44C00305G0001 [uncultured bacterium]|nr:MAG: hypothetical protein ACD_44C00305G0001 [uncultured bacterium]